MGENISLFFLKKKTASRIRNPGAYRAAIIARQQRELKALEAEIKFFEQRRKELIELKKRQERLIKREIFGFYNDERGYRHRLFNPQQYSQQITEEELAIQDEIEGYF